MTYSVLALDQSMTSSGFAHFKKGDAAPTYGLFKLPPWQNDEGKYLWQWFENFGKMCVDKQVTHLFVEDVRFLHKHEETLTQMVASIGLIGMAAIIAYRLTERGQPIEFQAVSPIDWRREFLGNMHKPGGIADQLWRRMLKEAAVTECHKRGWLVDGNDMADALGIMTFGICTIDDSFRLQQGPLFRRAASTFEEKVREA